MRKVAGQCETPWCTDPVSSLKSRFCSACRRWLSVWSNRTPTEVGKRVYQIHRLASRADTMPLPGVRDKGKLVQFRRRAS